MLYSASGKVYLSNTRMQLKLKVVVGAMQIEAEGEATDVISAYADFRQIAIAINNAAREAIQGAVLARVTPQGGQQ